MKKFLLAITAILCCVTAKTQSIHNMCEFTNGDTLRVCQDNPTTIIQKDTTFSGEPYWITQNGETHHGNDIVINHENAGWLLYTEKEPENYKNVYVIFQELPEEQTFHIFLEEDEIMVLKPTQKAPTFFVRG